MSLAVLSRNVMVTRHAPRTAAMTEHVRAKAVLLIITPCHNYRYRNGRTNKNNSGDDGNGQGCEHGRNVVGVARKGLENAGTTWHRYRVGDRAGHQTDPDGRNAEAQCDGQALVPCVSDPSQAGENRHDQATVLLDIRWGHGLTRDDSHPRPPGRQRSDDSLRRSGPEYDRPPCTGHFSRYLRRRRAGRRHRRWARGRRRRCGCTGQDTAVERRSDDECEYDDHAGEP